MGRPPNKFKQNPELILTHMWHCKKFRYRKKSTTLTLPAMKWNTGRRSVLPSSATYRHRKKASCPRGALAGIKKSITSFLAVIQSG